MRILCACACIAGILSLLDLLSAVISGMRGIVWVNLPFVTTLMQRQDLGMMIVGLQAVGVMLLIAACIGAESTARSASTQAIRCVLSLMFLISPALLLYLTMPARIPNAVQVSTYGEVGAFAAVMMIGLVFAFSRNRAAHRSARTRGAESLAGERFETSPHA